MVKKQDKAYEIQSINIFGFITVLERNVMTLKECLLQTCWQGVSADLFRLFPGYIEHLPSLQLAYDELSRTKPGNNNTRITIGRYHPNSELSFYIVGFAGDSPKGFSLKFTSWHKWLGSSLDSSLYEEYSYSEIIAICLNDMVWAGFSSEQVLAFRQEFIHHEHCLWAIYAYEEAIQSSEPNLIKCKQRSNEFNEALNLYDIDYVVSFDDESPEFSKARQEMEVQVYCLGETETDYATYCCKVSELRENFRLRWSDPNNKRPSTH